MPFPKKSSVPELGLFYGDQGGPGTSLPSTDAHKLCPFLAGEDKAFCSLDGALCPFIGFNYRRCKKYTNNMAKGSLQANDKVANVNSNKNPPRMEALTEAAKKRGSASEEDVTKALNSLEAKDIKSGMFAAFATDLGVLADEGASPEALKAHQAEIEQQLLDFRLVTPPIIGEPEAGESAKDRRTREAFTSKKVDAQKVQIKKKKLLVNAYISRTLGSIDDSGRRANVQAAADALFDFATMSVEQGVPDITHYQTRQANLRHHSAGNAEDLFFGKYSGRMKHSATSASTEDPDNRPHEPRKGPHRGTSTPSPKGHPGPRPRVSRAGESQAKGRNTYDDQARADKAAKKRRRKAEKKASKKAAKKATAKRYKELEREVAKGERGKAPAYKRHTSGQAQTSTKVRTSEQFNAWAEELPKHYSKETLESVFRGGGRSVKQNVNVAKQSAKNMYKKNDVQSIAKLKTAFENKLNDFDDIEHKKVVFEREFKENERRARILDPHLDDKLKAWRTDPERLGKIATMQNKAARRFYKLEHQKVKIGNIEVMQTLRKATMPMMTRADYEVIRMSEQLGLAAIQKQHQYGRKYGKFNTWNLFSRQVLLPIFAMTFGKGHAQYIPILQRMWPQAWLDAFFFSYVEKPLPKYQRYGGKDTGLVMSRDDKSMTSQRMVSGRSKKLMRGFDQDYVMPPDRAVLHTQWRPTTKKSWGKIRHKELAKRFQAAKVTPPAGAGETWRRGFLRR